MTLLLMSVGALAAAAGTRLAGLALVGAAVVGARTSLPAVATWAAVTAALLVWSHAQPRRLALPILGTAAAVAFGSVRNTAVVLAVWVVGTSVAALSAGREPVGRRWALTLCVADLPVVAAVAWTAQRIGLEGWPEQLDSVAVSLLVAAALLRAFLASGPDDAEQEVGLLAVRFQAAVLLVVALGSPAIDRGVGVGVVVAGAVLFAAAGAASRAATRDAAQEITLIAVVMAGARIAGTPAGWEWGALAAGTLIHNLRLRLAPSVTGRLAGALLVGGGLGLPFLPVVVAALEGSVRASGWDAAVVSIALVAGLGARASAGSPVLPARSRAARWEVVVSSGVLAMGLVASLWAPSLGLPRPPAGAAVGWPPAWGAASVAVLAAGAAVVHRGRSAAAFTYELGSTQARHRLYLPEVRLPGKWARPRALIAAAAALVAAALGSWVVGVLRGFL